ncbi:MAG TPA: hypothetical protein VJM46_01750 [Candidatus Saccharimonadales bacterium]|nr:hypothetical protein [Candidatus Saccharimonadales bacterium]
MAERKFDLGIVLSLATNKRFANAPEIKAALDYMFGRTLEDGMVVAAAIASRPWVVAHHPELAREWTPTNVPKQEALRWIGVLKARYGDQLPLRPLPPHVWVKLSAN